MNRLARFLRQHSRIRTLCLELRFAEQTVMALQYDVAELRTDRTNLRRDIVEKTGELLQARMEIARWRERAETMARFEEDAWQLAEQRAAQLRRYGYIPVGIDA